MLTFCSVRRCLLNLFKNEITNHSTTPHGHGLTVAASLCEAPVARRATATGRQPGRMLGDGLPTGRYVTRASRLQLIVDQTLAAQIEDCFARARSSGRAEGDAHMNGSAKLLAGSRSSQNTTRSIRRLRPLLRNLPGRCVIHSIRPNPSESK